MESIKHSIQELTQHFNVKMAEFQENLNSSVSATSPTSTIATQFSTFRSFVLTALEGLQLQVQLLTRQYDSIEMRSRRKILLVHGIQEDKKENTTSVVIRVLSQHLKVPDLTVDNVSRCQRIGTPSLDKPRPILLKFRDYSLRNQVWYSKANLKSTGITLSEFLTKSRHETFMAARQRFGISKCWTKDGFVIVTGPDGKRHSVVSCAELNNIVAVPDAQVPAASASCVGPVAVSKAKQTIRAKRIVKK